MLKTRVIPCLLLDGLKLVKTVQFKNPIYIGDPMNAVRIFNTKEVDELVLLDISATRDGRAPQFDLIAKIAEECQMPLTVGGGIRSVEDIKELLNRGVEKVVMNTYAVTNPSFIREASEKFGSQSIVVSMDAQYCAGSYQIFTQGGSFATGLKAPAWAKQAETLGAGEILLNSIDQDGTMSGYDLNLIRQVTSKVNIPVTASGGAGKLEDFALAVREGASAVTAGSFFVFHGRRKAVLINFPTKRELEEIFE